jgi:hypothetical protein
MFLANKKILMVKREAVDGTDSVPTISANALEATNIKFSYAGDSLERNPVRATLSGVAPILGQRWVDISFTLEVKGGGTKGTASRLGDALVACGLAEVASAGSSVTYQPSDSTMLSATVYFYELQDAGNCKLHKVTGCKGSVAFNIEAGKIATADFKLQGIAAAPADAAAPAAPTYETTLPPIVESSVFTLNSVALIAQSLKVNLENEVVKRDDLSSAAGLKGFQITGRKVTGSINPEAVLLATYDIRADWLAATARALSMVVGSAAGNKVTITAPKLVIEKMDGGERNGINTDELSFVLAGNPGANELVLKFE